MRYKQIIAVRNDISMSSGKLAVQVAHASLSSADIARKTKRRWYKAWKAEGQKKVVVKVMDEEEIIDLCKEAVKADLPCYLVNDSGLTELAPGTVTTLGIGPGSNEKLDPVTGHLKLL